MDFGSQHYGLASSSTGVQSWDGSFRKAESVMSSRSASSISRRSFKAIKECAKRLIDIDLFRQNLENWIIENSHDFKPPFAPNDLQNLDFALESVLFQQLHRMPRETRNSKEDEFLALEDFLHAISDSLWNTFWDKNLPSPYSVSCPRYSGSKFYTVDQAISRGRLDSLCGAALVSKTDNDRRVHWDQVVQLTLFKTRITKNKSTLTSSSICEALFFGLRILLSRKLNNYKTDTVDCVYIVALDSNFGGVVKLEGDVSKLELISGDLYLSMTNWIKHYAKVNVSEVDRIWNAFGNANWRDLGTLRILLASFHSISWWTGGAKTSIGSLASDHAIRLHQRRRERGLVVEDEMSITPLQEIIKVVNENDACLENQDSRLKLKEGEVLVLEDHQQSFRVQECVYDCCYRAVDLANPEENLTLYVGAHPSRLQPSWEDMSLWYQVQRQTKVLNIFEKQGIVNENLPRTVASGRISHSGTCTKPTPKARCDHTLCGTPILVVQPVGAPLSTKPIPFDPADVVRCCRDSLAALKSAKTANVQHGDICPENIIVSNNVVSYVLVSWGRAVLDDKDTCPAVNLRFSSAYALQNGKLCPSSDAESLVYLLYYVSGGKMAGPEEIDSIESALKWRKRSWGKRVIQQHLGEVSSVLKAFADYVDGLCGTRYAFDYDVWLERFDRAVNRSGKVRIEDVSESSY